MAIQYESLRMVIDPAFRSLREELREAYYGPKSVNGEYDRTGWVSGNSIPFRGFDVQETPELSKILFDKIHGAIFQLYTLVLHDENVAQGMPYDRADYDEVRGSRVPGEILDAARRAGRELTQQEFKNINSALTDLSPKTVIIEQRKWLQLLRDGVDSAIFTMLSAWAISQGFDADVNRTD